MQRMHGSSLDGGKAQACQRWSAHVAGSDAASSLKACWQWRRSATVRRPVNGAAAPPVTLRSDRGSVGLTLRPLGPRALSSRCNGLTVARRHVPRQRTSALKARPSMTQGHDPCRQARFRPRLLSRCNGLTFARRPIPRQWITPNVCEAHPLDPGSMVSACAVPTGTACGASSACNAGEL